MRILNAEALCSHGNVVGRKHMVEILEAGLRAADPYYNTLQMMRVEKGRLIVGAPDFEPSGMPVSGPEIIDLHKIGRILVFGAGKGVHRVAEAIEDVLGDRLEGGHIVVKHGDEVKLRRIGYTHGAHPAPDEGCALGCQRMLDMARGLTANDLVFTIAGNGVSSLMTVPAPGLTMEDLRQTTYQMQIVRGAFTGDLGPVRNHIDAIKGGRLTRAFQPARAIHLIAVDPNNNAGPSTTGYQRLVHNNTWLHFFPDCSTYADAIAMLKKYDAWEAVPERVRQHLLRADPAQETVKPAEFEQTRYRIFGVMPDKIGLVPTAMKKATELGYRPHRLSMFLRAEAREAGNVIGTIARTIEEYGTPFEPPCALFTSGELIVTVGDAKGIGGRNQEYALGSAEVIARSQNVVVGAVDSDGTDGPGAQFADKDLGIPNLAGGIVDGYTLQEAKAAGIDIRGELQQHNTTPPLWKLNSGVLATHNISVNDLGVALVMGRYGA